MKKDRIALLVVFGLIAALLVGGSASAKGAEVSEFTMVFEPSPGFDTPGRQWMPDGRLHIRGATNHFVTISSTDSRICDRTDVVLNANVTFPDFVGPTWGTWAQACDDMGWEGTWTGKFSGPASWYVTMVGHGQESLEGQKLWMYGEFDGVSATIVGNGYILNPHP